MTKGLTEDLLFCLQTITSPCYKNCYIRTLKTNPYASYETKTMYKQKRKQTYACNFLFGNYELANVALLNYLIY